MSGIGKEYRLGVIGGRTFQEELQSKWAKFRGKEDPNVKIGTDTSVIGEKFWALKDIDLTIYQGERIGIIGANGAGKSTLLKLICQITAPTTGDIDLYGRVCIRSSAAVRGAFAFSTRDSPYANSRSTP